MKNKPKYKKTPFEKWTNYKDLSTFPEKLIGQKLLVVIKGHYKELLVEDVASVGPAEFNPNIFSVLLLDENGKWHSLLGCQIKFVLEEIEYDRDEPVKRNSETGNARNPEMDNAKDESYVEQMRKSAEEWNKLHPYTDKTQPWEWPKIVPPYYPPYYPPYIPQYPGWQPGVWCQSESSPFNSESPYKRY